MSDPPVSADITGSSESSTDFSTRVKRSLQADLRECRWSRAEIAAMLTEMAGRTISEYLIDAWCAETKAGHRFPAEMVGPWVKVTGSRRLIDLICADAGFMAADRTDRELAEFGRARLREERARADAERLRDELWGRV